MSASQSGFLVFFIVLALALIAIVARGINRREAIIKIMDDSLFIGPGLLVCMGVLIPHSTVPMLVGAGLIISRVLWKARRRS